jgi:hypothetical protein
MFQFFFQLDQPSLGLPSFVLKGNNLTSFPIQAYLTFISGVAHTIRDAIGGGANDTDITKDVEDLINFHIELANVKFNCKSFHKASIEFKMHAELFADSNSGRGSIAVEFNPNLQSFFSS